jgi:hypothetical protein
MSEKDNKGGQPKGDQGAQPGNESGTAPPKKLPLQASVKGKNPNSPRKRRG